MAGEQTRAFIDAQRKAGKSDSDIFLAMMDSPKFSAGIQKGNQLGHSNRDIALGLGLNLPERKAVDLDAAKHGAMLDEAKKQGPTQAWESGLLGFSDLGAGVVQGASYASDAISKGINKIAGTNLDTKTYDRFTQQRKDIEEQHDLRREAYDQGFDWARLGGQVAGTAPLAATGRTYQGAKILSKAGAEVATHNAALGAAMGGASFAGDSEQRAQNIAFGAVGGAAGGAIGEKIGQGAGKAIQAGKNTAAKFSTERTNQILGSIDQKLDEALRQSGSNITLGQLSDDIVNGLRQDALNTIKSGRNLSPEAVARKVILDRLGLKGTQAQLTGDPKLWQRQAELAKINGAGDPIRGKLIDDNEQLKSLLDEATRKTGGNATDQYGAMQGALNSIDNQLGQNKEFVKTAYEVARNAPGNDIKLDGKGFANDAFTALEKNYAASSLPSNVQKIIKDINDNPDMFTLGKSEEFIKILNREYKASLQNGQPTSSTHAIGLVRDALNNRKDEAMQGLISNGNDAAQAYQFARQAHQFNAKQIESMPLLQDAVKGIEPDKLFNKHVLNGNVAELSKTVDLLNNVNPQAVNDIKQQVLQFISNKAVNQNGQFSPAGMKRALDSIGQRRLATMFSPDEIGRIQDIGMAGHYLVTQPAHSYINNSNTASALMNHLSGLINKPGVRMLLAPVKDIKDSRQVSKMMDSSMPKGEVSVEFNPDNATLIERLTRAGLISGSNLPNQ